MVYTCPLELILDAILAELDTPFQGAFAGCLQQFGMTASMSRQGNCYDNASFESFWGTLKNELAHHRRYITRQHAKDEVTEYIEMFYNRQRTQARLEYVSPAFFTQQFYLNQLAVQPVGVHRFRPTSLLTIACNSDDGRIRRRRLLAQPFYKLIAIRLDQSSAEKVGFLLYASLILTVLFGRLHFGTGRKIDEATRVCRPAELPT